MALYTEYYGSTAEKHLFQGGDEERRRKLRDGVKT